MTVRASRGEFRGAVALGLFALTLAAPVAAQQSWVKDEVRLNIRSGPSHQHRIIATVRTGDAVAILDRGEGWTQVRDPQGKVGWVPAGFLMADAPAAVRAVELESELAALQAKLASATEEAAGLRSVRDQAATEESERAAQLEALTAENLDLKAGQRWPSMITGAGLFVFGMVVGAILRSPRRRSTRIRI